MITQVVVWLNTIANWCAAVALAPIAVMPGWLSATLVAVVTGLVMLVFYKYTSNQSAIRRVRNRIKANLLALSLFKENVFVGLRAQGRLLVGAGGLLLLSVPPMLVMLVPMCLLLGQLALWYQARPLRVGEEAVVTVRLAESAGERIDDAKLVDAPGITTTVGPVHVPAKNMVCWNVEATDAGCHRISFGIGGQTFEKELAVGERFMPVSLERPSWSWTSALLHPREEPFPADSLVQSIEVVYPERESWTSGTNWWLVYWFVVSLVAAFVARPLFKVNI